MAANVVLSFNQITFRTGLLFSSGLEARFNEGKKSPLHVLPKGFHRIRHYGSLPPPTAPRASRRPAHSSMSPRLPPTPKSSRMLRRIARVCCPAHAPAVALA
jgi:hypothetical protein